MTLGSIQSDTSPLQNNATRAETQDLGPGIVLALPPSPAKADAAYNKYYAAHLEPIDRQLSLIHRDVATQQTAIADLENLSLVITQSETTIARAEAELNRLAREIPVRENQLAALQPELDSAKAVHAPLEAQSSQLEKAKADSLSQVATQLAKVTAEEEAIDELIRQKMVPNTTK